MCCKVDLYYFFFLFVIVVEEDDDVLNMWVKIIDI